jgi:hypothetical protein
MNPKRFAMTLVAALAFGLFQPAATAQLTNDIESEIPFSFTVGNKTLAAGKYVFHAMDADALEVRSATGQAVVMQAAMQAQKETAPKESELVFHRIGKQEFLYQVFLQGNAMGVELERSKAERELEGKGLKAVGHSHPAKMHVSKAAKTKTS